MPKAKNILIVDDEAPIRISLAGFMEDSGFNVYTASSAEEALDIIEQTHFDAAIVDLRLPGITGDIMILKSRSIQPTIKFLIHTGSVNFELSQELIDAGVTKEQVYLKPVINLSTLVDAVTKMLDEKDSEND